jgi:hypothetical protein
MGDCERGLDGTALTLVLTASVRFRDDGRAEWRFAQIVLGLRAGRWPLAFS